MDEQQILRYDRQENDWLIWLDCAHPPHCSRQAERAAAVDHMLASM
ncbi:hypothetical protein [Fodinicola feengrottensis]|nr:hypothetical protein [Fodinicola feengrottensis]